MKENKLKYGRGDEILSIAPSPAWKYHWNKRRLGEHSIPVGGFDRKTGALWDGFRRVEGKPLNVLLEEHAKSVEAYTDAVLSEDNSFACAELARTYDPRWELDICSVEKSFAEAGKWYLLGARLGSLECRRTLLAYPRLYNPNGEEF